MSTFDYWLWLLVAFLMGWMVGHYEGAGCSCFPRRRRRSHPDSEQAKP